MNRVIHFDIYADDPERASKFYEQVFGWKFEKWEGEGMKYWLITTGPSSEPGINGGMALREGEMKKSASVWSITIGVDNIDEAIEKVKKFGGEIAMKKMGLPKVGWFANFKDTEGNIISLMQADMSAE
jgi:uncharacterized protein